MLQAVADFGRYRAYLPSFPRGSPDHIRDSNAQQHQYPPRRNECRLRVAALDRVPGEVLPRPEATWLALAPFQDLASWKLSRETKTQLVRARRAFVELLARLADSPMYGWRGNEMFCGEMIGLERATQNAFWFDLLSDLSPQDANNADHSLERGLLALSRARRPRFLLCLEHGVSTLGLPRLLKLFLLPPDAQTEPVLFPKLITDGLRDANGSKRLEVEIGLSFSVGEVPWAVLAQVLDVIDRAHANRDVDGVRFRVTTLRFGPNCTLPVKSPSDLDNVSPLQSGVYASGTCQTPYFRLDTSDGFVPLAAALRCGKASRLEELDIENSATLEYAAWLAFALFHVDSQSTVTSVCLRSPRTSRGNDLSSEWLETFTRVLHRVCAERDVVGFVGEGESQGTDTTPSMRTFVRLQSDAVVRVAAAKSSKKLCTIASSTPPEEFECLARHGSAVAIVVAGVGVGWVSSVSVVSERTEVSRAVPHAEQIAINRRVTSFKWDRPIASAPLNAHGFELLLKLLSIIGEPLRCLHLPALKLQTKHLASLLRYCPNLMELNVSGHAFVNIQPLVDVYAGGQCRIANLSIARPDEPYTLHGDLIPAMSTILRGPGGHAVRQLVVHALPLERYDAQRYERSREWRDRVLPLACAVSASSNVEFLHLPGLDRFNGGPLQDLPVIFKSKLCPRSMRLDTKLAFLSVVYRSDCQSSLSRLDVGVLSLVFHFCSDSVVRRVLRNASLPNDLCECGLCKLRRE